MTHQQVKHKISPAHAGSEIIPVAFTSCGERGYMRTTLGRYWTMINHMAFFLTVTTVPPNIGYYFPS
jgi:hypothetical protein